jgi:hypothetical protein
MTMGLPKSRRTVLIAATAVLFCYVASYLCMSAAGQWTFSQTGMRRYSFGLSVSDIIRWQPAVAYWEPFHDIGGAQTSRGNLIGYLYSPLIRVDRAFVHRDKPVG